MTNIMERLGWGTVSALVLAMAGFLGTYDALRNKGGLFVCDMAGLLGQGDALSICRQDGKEPSDADQLALMEYLKQHKDTLSPKQLKKLHQLEAYFIEHAFTVLTKAANLPGTPSNDQARLAKKQEIRETIEQGNTRERQALALIATGDIQGGLDLLGREAQAGSQEQAKKWRRIGRLAFGVDTVRALDAYKKVIALDHSDPWDSIFLGRLHQQTGGLSTAQQVYKAALKRLPESDKRNRSVLITDIGDIQRAQGDLAAALTSYRAAMRIGERLAKSDPNHAGWQRDVSVSHERIGNVQRAQGDLAAALTSYRAAMTTRKRLAKSDPNNADWQRDVSVSHDRIGNVQRAQGDLAAALTSYRAAMTIRKRLAKSDPNNAGWQRDVSVSHDRIGGVQRAQGDLAAALTSYRAAMTIRERLAKADPDNADWQRDLVVSQWRLAKYPNSGVTWKHVAASYEKMSTRGTLLPGDIKFAEEAKRLANLEQK